jgi:hypothetical protein
MVVVAHTGMLMVLQELVLQHPDGQYLLAIQADKAVVTEITILVVAEPVQVAMAVQGEAAMTEPMLAQVVAVVQEL